MNGLGLDAAGGPFIAPKTSMAGASRVTGYLLRKGLCPDGQGVWSACVPAATIGYAEKVGSQFLSLRQVQLKIFRFCNLEDSSFV
jgi:hypothetical protein